MKPTIEELNLLVAQGKTSEILYELIYTGTYLVDRVLPKGWTPYDIPMKTSDLGDGWWYIKGFDVERSFRWSNHTEEERSKVLSSGNYFQTEMQARRALEKVREILLKEKTT